MEKVPEAIEKTRQRMKTTRPKQGGNPPPDGHGADAMVVE
jgi:hypothetical protein